MEGPTVKAAESWCSLEDGFFQVLQAEEVKNL